MKKYYTILIIFLILLIPLKSKAKVNNYETSINKSSHYIYDFIDYQDYIVTESMPYDYSNSKNNKHTKFQKNGFISKEEYLITNIYNNSYLATGIEYWTLTQYDYIKNYVVNINLSQKNIDKESNSRVTYFIKEDAEIEGSGTKNNPWYFLDVLSVNLVSKDENRATLSLKECTNISQGEKIIVLNKHGEKDGGFYICEDKFFRFYIEDTSCKNYIKNDIGTNRYYISGDVKDNMICELEFVYKTYELNLQQCNGCEIKTKPTTVYLAHKKNHFFSDSIGRKIITSIENTPSKKGYTYEGYYNNSSFTGKPIIDKYGNFNSKEITSNQDLYLNMRPHKYQVNYNCNGGSGSTSSTIHTYDEPQELRNVGCYKDGYVFKGWSDTQKGTVKYTNKKSVSNLTHIDNGNITLFAVWEICPAGKYNIGGQLTCSDCDAGTYSTQGSSSCTTCPAGKYNMKKGSPTCDDCPAGKYCTGGTNNVQCPQGYSSLKGAKTQSECKAYRCASGTLTYDDAKGTYICVRNADVNSYKCNCQTCRDPYSCVVSQNCGSYSTQSYTYTDTCYQSGTCISKHTICVNVSCTVTRVVTNYESCTKTYSCTKTGTKQVYNPAPCYGTCYGSPYECNCQTCYSYTCPSGWSAYTGSNSTLTCYKAATIN